MQGKVGGILKGYTVTRADGRVERYDGLIHNFMTTSYLISTDFLRDTGTVAGSIMRSRSFGVSPNYSSAKLNSGLSFNVETKQLSGITPQSSWLNSIYVGTFITSTGEIAQGFSGNSTAGFVNLSNDSFGDVTGKSIYQYCGPTYTAGTEYPGTPSVTMSGSYANGLYSASNTVPAVYTASLVVDIKCLVMRGNGTSYVNMFDLPTPVSLGIGDTITVETGDFVVSVVFNETAIREFTAETSPVAGIAASGRYQRLIPVFSSSSNAINGWESQTTATERRVFLLDDANKITIPNDFLQTPILSNTLVPFAEITGLSSSAVASNQNNDFMSSLEIFAAIQQEYTGVKQIIIGSIGGGYYDYAYSVIEFDTPVTLPADMILRVTSQLQILPSVQVPTVHD